MYALSTKQEVLLAANVPKLTVQRTIIPDNSTGTQSLSDRPLDNKLPLLLAL